MKTKKMLSGLLCLSLCLSMLCGCGKQAPSAPSGEASSAENTSGASALEEQSAEMPVGFDKANINWIVPAAAGSAIDLVTRGAADAVGKDMGANIVVENLAGASQTVGAAEFSIREASGRNILTMANACYFTQPLLNDLTYNITDWRPICNLAPPSYCCVAVKTGSELTDAETWIEKLKSGNFTYGFANSASIGHLAALQALEAFGAGEGTAVVYNGSPELTAAVLSGEIDFAVMEDNVLLNYVQSGEMAAVMTCTTEPHAYFPDVACIGEYDAQFVPICGVKCAAVLQDTPPTEAEWVQRQLNQALASDSYQEYLESNGYSRMEIMTEEDLTAWLADLSAVAKDVMQKAKLIG